MLSDIVTDANVFGHGGDPNCNYFGSACDFFGALQNSNTRLCIDEAFDLTDGATSSRLAREYRRWAKPGTVPFEVLKFLVSNSRLKIVSHQLEAKSRKMCLQCCKNPVDRRYLALAVNSDDCVLVSHDWEDFPTAVRTRIRSELEVFIVEASEATPLLS